MQYPPRSYYLGNLSGRFGKVPGHGATAKAMPALPPICRRQAISPVCSSVIVFGRSPEG
ncbi:MAG: hypothetical protein OXU61_07990 [Gammaproteobacteria bacterium]|nr:hypothetical protein [Gammaproteobacteria bacterium]